MFAGCRTEIHLVRRYQAKIHLLFPETLECQPKGHSVLMLGIHCDDHYRLAMQQQGWGLVQSGYRYDPLTFFQETVADGRSY